MPAGCPTNEENDDYGSILGLAIVTFYCLIATGVFLLTTHIIGTDMIVNVVHTVLGFLINPVLSLINSNPTIYAPLFFGLFLGIALEIARGMEKFEQFWPMVALSGSLGWIAMVFLSSIDSLCFYLCGLGISLAISGLIKNLKSIT